MNVAPGALHGVLVFTPTPVHDDRGFFTRTFDVAVATEAGLDVSSFIQDSQSRSAKGVVRGLHFRHDGREAKLVRCARGAVMDVAVDLRPWSPTYRAVQRIELDDVAHQSVFLPAGLAHGLQALSDSDVCYRIDAPHRPEADATLAWNDTDLGIEWPLEPRLISARDQAGLPWATIEAMLNEEFAKPGSAGGAA